MYPTEFKERALKMLASGQSARQVAQELGISFDGEQDWTPGVPGNVYWAFTQRDRARPGAGITFYVKPGASREEIAQRWQEKKQQFNIAA